MVQYWCFWLPHMCLNALLYLVTIHEEIRLVRCQCVYRCKICRIDIPKKLQCSHFSLWTKQSSLFNKVKVQVACILHQYASLRNQTHDLYAPFLLQNDWLIAIPISCHEFEIQKQPSHLRCQHKWIKRAQEKLQKIDSTFLKWLG